MSESKYMFTSFEHIFFAQSWKITAKKEKCVISIYWREIFYNYKSITDLHINVALKIKFSLYLNNSDSNVNTEMLLKNRTVLASHTYRYARLKRVTANTSFCK